MPWPQAVDDLILPWQQGEHVTLLGRTGAGKTTLGLWLLRRRKHVVVVATKARDPLTRGCGWPIIRSWPPPPNVDRVVLWPKMRGQADIEGQREQVGNLLEDALVAGGWTVYLDELQYVTDPQGKAGLGLESEVMLLLRQGRSLGATMVMGFQQPRHVPTIAYSQTTLMGLFREQDRYNLRRLDEICAAVGGISDTVTGLDWDAHEVALVDLARGSAKVTVAPPA